MEVVQLLGSQWFQKHQVFGGVGGQGSRKYSPLEECGNLYWSIQSNILAWRTPLTEKPSRPQSTGWQRVEHDQSDSAHIDARLFCLWQLCPGRVKQEGSTAAWLVGTLMEPGVQGHGLPPLQELWLFQSLFSSLLQLATRRPLWPVFLRNCAHSGIQRAPSPGVLSCCSAHQAQRAPPHPGWAPTLQFSASGVCWASLSTVQLPMLACGETEAIVMAPPLCVTQKYCLPFTATWLSSTGISHHSLPPHILLVCLSAVNSSPDPGIAPQSLNSQLLCLLGDLRPCPGCVMLWQGLSDSHPIQAATDQLFHSQP